MSGLRGLSGRRTLITGAASGIGQATAIRLGEEGAPVGILDLDGQAAEETAVAIRNAGGEAIAYAVDITDLSRVEEAVDAFERESGPIRALVNNAGWDLAANFLDTDPGQWRKIVDINLFGPLNVTKTVLSRMVERGCGSIVRIASDAGRVGSSGESVYAAFMTGQTISVSGGLTMHG